MESIVKPLIGLMMMSVLVASGKVLKIGSNILTTLPPPETEPVGFTDPANWTRYASNPVIEHGAGGAWDDEWIQPDSVIKLADNTYRLYYSGGGTDAAYTDKIGYASSPDGLAWTKYGSNPIFEAGAGGQWDQGSVSHFVAMREGADYYAWYGGHNTGGWEAGAAKIGYATSSDGISWTRYGSNPVLNVGGGGAWDAAFVMPASIYKEGSTYYLWYWGGAGTPVYYDQSLWKIGYATSTDRVTWTKYAGNPVFAGATGQWDDGVLEPCVFKIGATYYMFYQGNQPDQQESRIGIATSSDMNTWTRSPNNPFAHGDNGQWDDLWNEAPKVIKVGATWMFYYMGLGELGAPAEWNIGVMTFAEP